MMHPILIILKELRLFPDIYNLILKSNKITYLDHKLVSDFKSDFFSSKDYYYRCRSLYQYHPCMVIEAVSILGKIVLVKQWFLHCEIQNSCYCLLHLLSRCSCHRCRDLTTIGRCHRNSSDSLNLMLFVEAVQRKNGNCAVRILVVNQGERSLYLIEE